MGDVVNLRRARKAKARADAERAAAANRAAFGRSKQDKIASAAERERLARTLDGHRRDSADDGQTGA